MHWDGVGGPTLQADTASRVAVTTIIGSSCARFLRLTRYKTTQAVDKFSDGGARPSGDPVAHPEIKNLGSGS
jgi:hypothetical protein